MVVKVKEILPAALRARDAATYLGVSPTSLDRLRAAGALEGFLHDPGRARNGHRLHWCYRKSELDRYIWERQEQTRKVLKQ